MIAPDAHVALVHRCARDLSPEWLGRWLIVGTEVAGGLSDYSWVGSMDKVLLWIGGRYVEVHENTTVTWDNHSGLLGGAS